MINVIKQLNLKENQNILFPKSHKHKEEYGVVLKETEYFRPESDEMNYILTIYFHTFEYRCVHDIKYTNMENIEEVNLKLLLDT